MENLTMRKLKMSDTFTMSKILKAMKIKINAKDENGKTKQDVEFGIELFMTVIENLHLAEDEVSSFLADMLGITVEEFKELDFEVLEEVLELFKQQKGFKVFSKLLS